MKICIANVIEVDGVWPVVGPKFMALFERRGEDLAPGELWQMCRSGQAFLVLVVDDTEIKMAAVVRFDRWTSGLVLRILALVGDGMRTWGQEVKNFLAAMAKDGGATRLVSEGREGWSRFFDEPKKLHSTYSMEI